MTAQAARMKIIAPLLFCAALGAAHAEPPAANVLILVPSAGEVARDEQAARDLEERRQRMIAECEQNHGSELDCQRETDTELRAERLQSGGRVIRLRPPG